MTPEQISRFLDDLGQRLTPAASHVFDLAVRQALINGVIDLIGCALLAAVFIGLLAWAYRHRGPATSDEALLFYALGAVFAIPIVAHLFHEGLSSVINPEYAALADLIGRVKP